VTRAELLEDLLRLVEVGLETGTVSAGGKIEECVGRVRALDAGPLMIVPSRGDDFSDDQPTLVVPRETMAHVVAAGFGVAPPTYERPDPTPMPGELERRS
jgi:hypothetical protein